MNYTLNSTHNMGVESHILVNGNALKTYNGKVFLKDKSNFVIQLKSDRDRNVLAKIFVNGDAIGEQGLILRPLEKVNLERFIKSNKKFLFNTYKIDKKDEGSVAKNGLIEIKFFDEAEVEYEEHHIRRNQVKIFYYETYCNPWPVLRPIWYRSPYTTTGGTWNGSCIDSNITFTNCSSNLNANQPFDSSQKNTLDNSQIETGRVEQGNKSEQTFDAIHMDFEKTEFDTHTYKLLPESQKNLVSSDLKAYCSECGRRNRKKEKYCPNCGTRY